MLQTHVNECDVSTIASERTPDEYVLAFNEPITNSKNNTDRTSIVNEKILDEWILHINEVVNNIRIKTSTVSKQKIPYVYEPFATLNTTQLRLP